MLSRTPLSWSRRLSIAERDSSSTKKSPFLPVDNPLILNHFLCIFREKVIENRPVPCNQFTIGAGDNARRYELMLINRLDRPIHISHPGNALPANHDHGYHLESKNTHEFGADRRIHQLFHNQADENLTLKCAATEKS